MYKYCENICLAVFATVTNFSPKQKRFVNWIFAYIKVYAVVWRINKKNWTTQVYFNLKKTAIAILVAEPNCLFCNTPKIGKDVRPLNNKNESCGYVTTMEEVILGGSLVILSFRPFMEGLT